MQWRQRPHYPPLPYPYINFTGSYYYLGTVASQQMFAENLHTVSLFLAFLIVPGQWGWGGGDGGCVLWVYLFDFHFMFIFEVGSFCVVQAGLQLLIHLPQLPVGMTGTYHRAHTLFIF